jgi:hypothetical protein
MRGVHWHQSKGGFRKKPLQFKVTLLRTFGTTASRKGTRVTEQHPRIRHTPAQSAFAFPPVTVRWQKAGELFWRYAVVAGDKRRTDAAASPARHRLKGGRPHSFVVTD